MKIPLSDTKSPEEKLHGIYRGVVENREDIRKMGRCKVRVFGVHDFQKTKTAASGVATNELPWAEPALGLTEGSVSGNGAWSVPLQGSHVFVFFEGGNKNQPRYFASAPGQPAEGPDSGQGFSDPGDRTGSDGGPYPTEGADFESDKQSHSTGEPDYHRLMRGESENTCVPFKEDRRDLSIETSQFSDFPGSQSRTTWDEPSPYYAAEYPNNIVFSGHGGITVELDQTKGAERIHIFHPSNTFIEIDKEGNVVIKNTGEDRFEVSEGNKKVHIMKDSHENVDGERRIRVTKDDIEEIHSSQWKTIDKDENHHIKENGNRHVGIDMTEKIDQDELVEIGRDQVHEVGQDQTRTVGRDRKLTVEGNETVKIGENQTVTIEGNQDTTVTGDRSVESSGDMSRTSGGTVTETATGDITINSNNRIVMHGDNGIFLSNSCGGLNISATGFNGNLDCFVITMPGACSITAPQIELLGNVHISGSLVVDGTIT